MEEGTGGADEAAVGARDEDGEYSEYCGESDDEPSGLLEEEDGEEFVVHPFEPYACPHEEHENRPQCPAKAGEPFLRGGRNFDFERRDAVDEFLCGPEWAEPRAVVARAAEEGQEQCHGNKKQRNDGGGEVDAIGEIVDKERITNKGAAPAAEHYDV